MTAKPTSNLELAIGLPLDVATDKLKRLEADLRHVNIKALAFAPDQSSRDLAVAMAARIETIYETLDSLRRLVSDIEADIRPSSATAPSPNRKHGTDRDD
jgi:hypothetical protein